jgi:hypothetical protein
MHRLAKAAGVSVVLLAAGFARAWDAAGHRMITRVALEQATSRLGEDCPAVLKDPLAVAMIADGATTPDRWRGTRVSPLTHVNNPDHYLDAEQLADYGLTMRTMPALRHELAGLVALARAKPGFKGEPANPARDPDRVQEYPGFIAQATMESWGRVVSSMKTLRILERLNEPSRRPQVEMARATLFYHMGVLAHFVGDAAQPLHTTVHHHGWVGDNPGGYTTDRKFHSWIDGGVVKLHRIGIDDVRARVGATPPPPLANDPATAWDAFLSELERSHAQVVPLYELKKSGDLEKGPGKAFIESRLADASGVLGSLYAGAWKASQVTDKEVQDFVGFDAWTP